LRCRSLKASVARMASVAAGQKSDASFRTPISKDRANNPDREKHQLAEVHDGSIALVTDAAQGIGRATALRLPPTARSWPPTTASPRGRWKRSTRPTGRGLASTVYWTCSALTAPRPPARSRPAIRRRRGEREASLAAPRPPSGPCASLLPVAALVLFVLMRRRVYRETARTSRRGDPSDKDEQAP
jgi:hypothetical protein